MKKKLLMFMFVALLFLVPCCVNAETGLQAKIDAAAEGAVITLDKDYAEYITVKKDITIDLAGHKITTNPKGWELINVVSCTLTIEDSVGTGKIVQTEADTNGIQLNVNYDAENVKTTNETEARAKVILKGGTIESVGHAVALFNNSEFVMDGGKVISTGDEFYAICGNGTMSVTSDNYGVNAKIVINKGEVTSADYAIYMPQAQGELVINGGTITGAAGAVAVNRGKVTVTGGTLKSLGTDASPKDQTVAYNGPDWATNAVIAIPAIYTEGVGTSEKAVVTINGTAKLVAEGNAELIATAIPNIAANTTYITQAKANTTLTITGGTFNKSVKTLIGENYVEELTSGVYTVKENKRLVTTDGEGHAIANFECETPMPNDYKLVITNPTLTEPVKKVVVTDATTEIAKTYKDEKKVEDTTILGTFDVSVKDTEGTVTISGTTVYKVSLKVDVKEFKNVKVVYLDENNKVKEVFDATIEEGFVVFNTTHLSNYAVVGYNTTTVKNPNTFDGIYSYVGLGALSLIGLIGAALYLNKNTKKSY